MKRPKQPSDPIGRFEAALAAMVRHKTDGSEPTDREGIEIVESFAGLMIHMARQIDKIAR